MSYKLAQARDPSLPPKPTTQAFAHAQIRKTNHSLDLLVSFDESTGFLDLPMAIPTVDAGLTPNPWKKRAAM